MKLKLLLAGIKEIEENGLQNFSMRQVAARCGVSCAAPYKHFTDKQEFLMEIIKYINDEWNEILHQIIVSNEGALKELIVEMCMSYVRFLLDNPHFRSVVMLKDNSMTEEFKKAKAAISDTANDIIARYCKQAKIPDDVRAVKQYIIRSLIYGAAVLVDNGEIEYTEEFAGQIREAIKEQIREALGR
ncbi:MAG: TetR/AcrR family transcriptional regulator [Lachnospiraceae bacterium]|nr:TetR/AcrR family transcriptional regulator [Lachnospiraceae bacterium]